MTVLVGKAKIDVHVRGCFDCGTEYSDAWQILKTVRVKIGKREFPIAVYRCGECDKAEDDRP